MKKGLLIGCLSIVILFVMFIILSPILAMMEMWGLFAYASRTEIKQAVHRSYENYGLTGHFELEKYEKNYTSVGGFVIHGTYTENIDGKPIKLIPVLNTILVLRKTKSIKRRMQK